MTLTRRKKTTHGSIQLEQRLSGPVWVLRYWERSELGKHKRKQILGSVQQFPTQDDAKRAAEPYLLIVNRENPDVPPPTMEAVATGSGWRPVGIR